jgi:hypothetical protein
MIAPLRALLGGLLAVWPLTLVMLMCGALLWAVGYHASP